MLIEGKRICAECRKLLLLSKFGSHKGNLLDKSYYCKECQREKARKRYSENKEYHQELSKKYYQNNREHVIERQKQKEKTKEYLEKERIRNRKRYDVNRKSGKQQARAKANYALKKGNIEKIIYCQICGCDEKLTFHHNNYEYPLDVIQICYRCHSAIENHIYQLHLEFKND